jgi:triacylglycerol lipase
MKKLLTLISLSLGCASCSAAPASPPPARKLVLVHGFLETGSAFGIMKRHFEKQGYQCFVPKLRPSDGRGGLEALSAGLQRDIEASLQPEERFSIVAFSMGGIVSRHYLQHLGGAKRCDHLFTISSPHNGTQAAWLYPTQGAREMRPDSEFLKNLQSTEPKLGSMPVVSYWTPMDLIILPAHSSVWDRADNIKTHSPLHPLMVTSRTVLNDISRRLKEVGTIRPGRP